MVLCRHEEESITPPPPRVLDGHGLCRVRAWMSQDPTENLWPCRWLHLCVRVCVCVCVCE